MRSGADRLGRLGIVWFGSLVLVCVWLGRSGVAWCNEVWRGAFRQVWSCATRLGAVFEVWSDMVRQVW
jgi:hypothetical protein